MPKSLRWGVLGTAGIARAAVIPAIKASRNGSLVAVGSRNPAAARNAFAASHAVPFLSYDALIADPEVDAVYIPLPNSHHADWAIRVAEAGKAVLCEKPLALDAAQAARIVARCKQLGVPLMEGFMYRSHPQHARVREIIESGEIGDVVEVRAHLCVDIMNPTDPNNVRFRPELGGGALMDMGCYAVSICRMMLAGEPSRVFAHSYVDPTYRVDVSTAAVLEFPEGRMGVISCSFLGNGQGSYIVVGRKGSIEVPRGIILGLGTRLAEPLLIITNGDGGRREEALPAVDQYRLMIESFADAVLAGTPVPLSPLDSIENMRVLDAIARSGRLGTAESV
jgi:D-xylose 1-dehydrogenase (NADP+, D-xylono-1,5-lactone-forming)